MLEAIRRLPRRAEFLLVNAICFAYPTVNAILAVASRRRVSQVGNLATAHAILFEVSAGVLALAILRVRGWSQRDFPIQASRGSLGAGILLWLGFLTANWLTWAAIVIAGIETGRLESFRATVSAAPALTLLFILINSLFEEIFAAGYVVKALEQHGPMFAITASAFIRSLYHVYQGPIAFAMIFLLGLMFAAVYWRWRNLFPLIIAHTLINLIAFAGSGS
jgi:membrane protease YdiL (CAAX protease family)